MTGPTYTYTGSENLGAEAVGEPLSRLSRMRDTLGLVFKAGGPGSCQFAVTVPATPIAASAISLVIATRRTVGNM